MNKNRLLILASALEEQHNKEPSKFDYRWWSNKSYNECGTTYCAFGLAACLPEFNKEGLRFRPEPGIFNSRIVLDGFTPGRDFNNIHYNNRAVASKFFEITPDEVTLLFIPGKVLEPETTGKEVSRLIRYFVENGSVQGFKSVYGIREYKEE